MNHNFNNKNMFNKKNNRKQQYNKFRYNEEEEENNEENDGYQEVIQKKNKRKNQYKNQNFKKTDKIEKSTLRERSPYISEQESKPSIKEENIQINQVITIPETIYFEPKNEDDLYDHLNYDYSVFIHYKHNKDWSEKSWIKLLDLNDVDNIGSFLSTISEFNVIDYDIYISKKNVIPIEENLDRHYRSDCTINDNYINVLDKFKDILVLLLTNQIEYNIDCIGLILKDTLFCIKIVSDPLQEQQYRNIIYNPINKLDNINYYKLEDVLGYNYKDQYSKINDHNYPITYDIFNKLTSKDLSKCKLNGNHFIFTSLINNYKRNNYYNRYNNKNFSNKNYYNKNFKK